MLENMFIGNPPGTYDRLLDFSHAVTGDYSSRRLRRFWTVSIPRRNRLPALTLKNARRRKRPSRPCAVVTVHSVSDL
jgi:hypothetical protein